MPPASGWLRLQALLARPKQTDSGYYERLAHVVFALRWLPRHAHARQLSVPTLDAPELRRDLRYTKHG